MLRVRQAVGRERERDAGHERRAVTARQHERQQVGAEPAEDVAEKEGDVVGQDRRARGVDDGRRDRRQARAGSPRTPARRPTDRTPARSTRRRSAAWCETSTRGSTSPAADRRGRARPQTCRSGEPAARCRRRRSRRSAIVASEQHGAAHSGGEHDLADVRAALDEAMGVGDALERKGLARRSVRAGRRSAPSAADPSAAAAGGARPTGGRRSGRTRRGCG